MTEYTVEYYLNGNSGKYYVSVSDHIPARELKSSLKSSTKKGLDVKSTDDFKITDYYKS